MDTVIAYCTLIWLVPRPLRDLPASVLLLCVACGVFDPAFGVLHLLHEGLFSLLVIILTCDIAYRRPDPTPATK